MAPPTTNRSLTSSNPYPFSPLESPESPSSSGTVTTIVFGLSAFIIGIITIKQSRNAWRIWHAHNQRAPAAQDHAGDLVNGTPDIELGNTTPAPIAAPEPEQSPLEQVHPSLTSPHTTEVDRNVDNPFEQLHESSANSMSTETIDVMPLDSSTISTTESAHRNTGGPAEGAPTLMTLPPAGGRAVI